MGRIANEEEQMGDNYDRYETDSGGGSFMMGLLTGTVLGAGLGMLLAPRAGAELRGQIGTQARNLGNLAADQYRRAGDVASGWAERGRDVVGRAREAVSRGAEEVRSYAGATGGNSGGSGASTFGSGTTGSTGSPMGSDFGRS